MSSQQTIRDFSGRVIGIIETFSNGDKTVKDFGGRVLGYYKAVQDVTTDFFGRIIAHGDACAMLLK